MFKKMSKLSIKRITEAMVMAAVMSGSVYGYAAPAATELPNLKEIVSGIDGQITTKTEKIGGVDHATMTINQAANTNVARIDWNTFNIGSNATVNVKQAVSSQTLINNVVGNQMSEIYGKINATGNIVLINPKGVVFGGNSEVNVGGLSVYATGVVFDGDNFKVDPNNALQGNITVKDNAKIHVGIGYAISQLSNLGFKADGSDYFIGRVGYDSNDNKLRLVAAGDVNIESTANSAPRLVATGHVSNTGEHAEGEEQFILEGAGSGSHSGIILRADADADDWGTVKINNQDVNNKAKIAGNSTVYYNPTSAVANSRTEKDASDKVVEYNKKDYSAASQPNYSNLFGTLTKAELEAENETAIANSSVHVMAGDSLKKAKEAGNVGALNKIEDDKKQLMLVNNINQLQDIEAAGTGNLAGNYALGRDINGTNDGTSVIKDGVIYVQTADGITVKSTDGFYVDASGKPTGVAANVAGKEGTDGNVNYVVKADVSTASKTNEAGNINVNYSYTTGAEDIAVTGTIKEGQTTYAYADGKVSAGDFSANATTISKGGYSYSGTQGAYKQGEKDVLVDATNVTIDNNTYTYNSETPEFIKVNDEVYAISSEAGAAALATFNAVQTGVAGLADNFEAYTNAYTNFTAEADSAAVKTLLASESAQYIAEKERIETLTDPTATPDVKLGMVDASKWDNGKGFNPIGTSNTAAFSGYFTGDDGVKVHDIVDLTIDRPQEDNVGLFSTLSGEVWHVNVEGPQITGKNNVGAVAGESAGKITNVGVTGNGINGTSAPEADFVKGKDNVGGLVGYAHDTATIGSAGNSATIVGNDNVGGIVGNAEKANMANVVNTGNVFGVEDTSHDPSTNVGGLAGVMQEGTISGSNFSPAFNNGQISGNENVGGLVGHVTGNNVVIKDAFNTNESGVLNGSSQIWVGADGKVVSVGGAYAVQPVMDGNHYDIQTWDGKKLKWDSDLAKYKAQQVKGRYMLVDNNGNPIYYEVKDAEGKVLGTEAIYVKQAYEWKDGDTAKAGNYISNPAMLSQYGEVTGKTNVGGLVGKMDAGTVERSYNAGNVTGETNVGGIVGSLTGGKVLSVYNADNNTVIRERREAADIPDSVKNANIELTVGLEKQTYMYNAVDSEYNSFFTVDDSGNRTYYYFLPNNGQLARGAQGVYVNAAGEYVDVDHTPATSEANRFYFNRVAYKDANVTGTANVGGLAGNMTGGTIANSYNAGTVTGTASTGALVGTVSDATKVTDSFFVTGINKGIITGTSTEKQFSRVANPFGTVAGNVQGTLITESQNPLNGVTTYTQIVESGNKGNNGNHGNGNNGNGNQGNNGNHNGNGNGNGNGQQENALSIYSGSFDTMTSESVLRNMKTGTDSSEWMSATNNISNNTQDGQAGKHTWITYKYTTLPLLYNLMKDDTIQRVFQYDGTTHNLKTNDVDNIYGMANFGNAWDGRNVIGTNNYGLSADPNSDSNAHSIYTYNSTSMWSPQHAYRTSEDATLEVLPNDITVTVEGERTYGQHHLQGYYVIVPGFKTLVDGKIVTADKYYRVAGDEDNKTHVEMTKAELEALGLDTTKHFSVNDFKQAAYKNGNYAVTVNGLVAGESVDGVLRGWLANKYNDSIKDVIKEGDLLYDQRNDVITNNAKNKYTLNGADYNGLLNTADGINGQYYLIDDMESKANPITVADNNNYGFGYKGSLKINKADLLYTYDGVKEYGQDLNAQTDGQITIVGADGNTYAVSANGLLKSFDKDDLEQYRTADGQYVIPKDKLVNDPTHNTVIAVVDGATATAAFDESNNQRYYTVASSNASVNVVIDKDGTVHTYDPENHVTGAVYDVSSRNALVQKVVNPDHTVVYDDTTRIYHVKVKGGAEGTKVVDSYQVLWTDITTNESALVNTLKKNYNFVFAGEGTHTMATTQVDANDPTLTSTAKPYLTNTTTVAAKSTQTITPKQLSVLVQTDRDYGDLLSDKNLRVNLTPVITGEAGKPTWNVNVDKNSTSETSIASFDYDGGVLDAQKVLNELNNVEDRTGKDQNKIGADTWVERNSVSDLRLTEDGKYQLDKYSTGVSGEHAATQTQIRGAADVDKSVSGSTIDFTDYYTQDVDGNVTFTNASQNILSDKNKYDYIITLDNPGTDADKGHYVKIRQAGVDVRIIGAKTYGEETSASGVSGHYVDAAGQVTDIKYQYEIKGLKNNENIGGVTNNVEQVTRFDQNDPAKRSYVIDLATSASKESDTIVVNRNGTYGEQFLDSEGGDIQREGNVINLTNGLVSDATRNFTINFGATTRSSDGFNNDNYSFSQQSMLVVDQRKVQIDTAATREYGSKTVDTPVVVDNPTYTLTTSDSIKNSGSPVVDFTAIKDSQNNALTGFVQNDGIGLLDATTKDQSYKGLDVKYDQNGNVIAYIDGKDINWKNNTQANFLDTTYNTNTNYEFVNGVEALTITPKALTITIDGVKTYGDATPLNVANTGYEFTAKESLALNEKLGNYTPEEMKEKFKLKTPYDPQNAPGNAKDVDGDVVGGSRDKHVDVGTYTGVFEVSNFGDSDITDQQNPEGFNSKNYAITYESSLKVTPRPIVIHIDRTQEQGQPIPTNPKDYNIVPSDLVEGENLNHLGDTTVVIKGRPYDIGKYEYQTGGTATYTDPSGIIAPTDSYIDSLDFKGQIGGGFKPSNYLISYDTALEILPPYDPTGELASGAANRRSMYSIQYLTIHGNGVNNRSLSEAVSNDSTGTYRADSQGK